WSCANHTVGEKGGTDPEEGGERDVVRKPRERHRRDERSQWIEQLLVDEERCEVRWRGVGIAAVEEDTRAVPPGEKIAIAFLLRRERVADEHGADCCNERDECGGAWGERRI